MLQAFVFIVLDWVVAFLFVPLEHSGFKYVHAVPLYGVLILLGLAGFLRKSNVSLIAFQKIFTVMSVGVVSLHWLFIIQSLQLPAPLGLSYEAWQGVALGLWTHLMGFAIRDIPPNPIIGFHKISDEIQWQKSHRLGGLIWIVGGFLSMLVSYIYGSGSLYFALAVFLAGGILPAISYAQKDSL